MNQHAQKHEVLIVGAGPTGLTAALELERHGIKARIIDKGAGTSIHSKAAGIHARTLEAFEDMGVSDDILAFGVKGKFVNFYSGERKLSHISFQKLPSQFSYIYLLPQSYTEKILHEHLMQRGIQVEWDTELVNFSQENGTVKGTLRRKDGQEEELETEWMIGCDGAHSTIRKGLHLPFEGSPYEDQFLLADVDVHGDLAKDEVHIFFHPDGIVVFFPLGGDHMRVVANFSENTFNPQHDEPTLEEIQQLIDKRCKAGLTFQAPNWMAFFKIHHRKVNQMRIGRVFLVGDAAHIHSPAGGQGMNTGVQDAYNLAWKLALVVHGKAKDILLESYSAEREPVAQHVIDITHRMTTLVMIRNPVFQTLRNLFLSVAMKLPVMQRRMTGDLSQILIHYPHSPILAQDWNNETQPPKPGYRAEECHLKNASTQKTERLFQIIRGTKHTLLLFTGYENDAAVHERLSEIGDRVQREFGDLIQYCFVSVKPLPDGNHSVYLDEDSEVHRLYNADQECLYLIRPDGYIGYRNKPASYEQLKNYLRKIFVHI